jgi:hypothetical protein
MGYQALFTRHEGQLFRLDTRIYLNPGDEPGTSDRCIAAVIGKNPGSAKPIVLDELAQLSLDNDKMLPYVRQRFLNAYTLSGIAIPTGAFVRVWNLVYLCGKDLRAATEAFQKVRSPLFCSTEQAGAPIVWFAWGPPGHRPFALTSRLRRHAQQAKHCFYYDMDSKVVVQGMPTDSKKVKHTQGLLGRPVEEYLAHLVC